MSFVKGESNRASIFEVWDFPAMTSEIRRTATGSHRCEAATPGETVIPSSIIMSAHGRYF